MNQICEQKNNYDQKHSQINKSKIEILRQKKKKEIFNISTSNKNTFDLFIQCSHVIIYFLSY